MKYGIIDVGSNSVRLLIINNEVSIRKIVKTTQLAEGIAITGCLSQSAMKDTSDAIVKLHRTAIATGCKEVHIFATEAIRSATNGRDFTHYLKKEYNLSVHVLSGSEESLLGFYGAHESGDTCVIDIGGGSTEIAIGNDLHILYAKSMPIGSVRLYDICGDRDANLQSYVDAFITSYGEFPKFNQAKAIGGTATTIVSIIENMSVYDPRIIHNYKLTLDKIKKCYHYVSSIPLEHRDTIVGLPEKRRTVIVAGMILLIKVMEMLKIDCVTISDKDNLEGYYKCFVQKTIHGINNSYLFDTII